MPRYLFRVPCPTPDKPTARDLHFNRAWSSRDGSAIWALALCETREGGSAFSRARDVEDEPGEETIVLEGDVGLVPVP